MLRDSAISLGLGLGAVSYGFFLLKWLAPDSDFAPVQWVLLAASLALLWRFGRKGEETRQPIESNAAFERPLAILFIAAGGVAFYVGARMVLALPHGEWDGWAIWNMHARFLFRGGQHWTSMFSTGLSWSHPDYPLLIPAAIAAGWTFVSGETAIISAAIGSLFWVATLLLLVSALSVEGEKTRGFAAGLTLLLTPGFVLTGGSQMADVPLSFFMLTTIVLLWNAGTARPDALGCIALAGAAASMAAWTKNEGLQFLVLLLPVRFISRWIRDSAAQSLKEILAFAGGAAPGLLVLVCFKLFLSPPNDLMAASGMDRLMDFSRYQQIWHLFGETARAFGGGLVNPAWVLVGFLAFLGMGIRREERHNLLTFLALDVLLIAGYFTLYLITPYDLEWHVRSSFHRLLLQLWPALLFVCFQSVALRTAAGSEMVRLNRSSAPAAANQQAGRG